MADPPNPDGLIAARLEHLFRTVHPAGRGPYTPADVAAAINADAREDVISGQYIWLLRTGRRDNPTYKHLIAISRFFGVSPMFFFDDPETERGAIPAEVAVALQDDAVRDLALRAAGLSERSLKAISDMVDSARSLQVEPPTQRSRASSRPGPHNLKLGPEIRRSRRSAPHARGVARCRTGPPAANGYLDLRGTGTPQLLDALRRAGAEAQVQVLIDRLPALGRFDLFRVTIDLAAQARDPPFGAAGGSLAIFIPGRADSVILRRRRGRGGIGCRPGRAVRAGRACPGWQASLLYCLQAAGFSLTDIDLVAVSGLGDQPPGPGEPGLHHLGINITRIRPVDHHLSHAYSA
ncbi:MAG TPA: hypothetical protein VH478_13450 [Trebonia sp.]|nr:hypothetical protein [Trebonia sp.]